MHTTILQDTHNKLFERCLLYTSPSPRDKAEYRNNPNISPLGFHEAVTIHDFPIRSKGVDLIVRKRKWYDKQNDRIFSDTYNLKEEGTPYSKEFATFLKAVYGDAPFKLP